MWLQAPVEQQDDKGDCIRTTRNKDQGRGTPQGAVISPLLANVYMRRFILGWKTLGYQQRLKAQIVNYADDFVICCRGTAEQAMTAMRGVMERLKLTVNEEKTHVCRLPQEAFDFLGYTVGRIYWPQNGRAYLGVRPSSKSVRKLCGEIREMTQRRYCLMETEERVGALNRKINGWANYFCLGLVSTAYRTVTIHTERRLRQWLRKKHKVQSCTARKRYNERYMHDVLGLIRPQSKSHSFSWAKA